MSAKWLASAGLFLALGTLSCEGGEPVTEDPGGEEMPPVEVPALAHEVIQSADPPCATVLVKHAFSDCRNNFWHVVTRTYAECDGAIVSGETQVVRTNQPCTAPAPGLAVFGQQAVPSGCQSPTVIDRLVLTECVSGFWNWRTYDVIQCADGTTYTQLVPELDRQTQVLCDQPAPTTWAP